MAVPPRRVDLFSRSCIMGTGSGTKMNHNRKVTMGSGRRMMKMAIPAVLLMMIFAPGCSKKKETSRIEGSWTVRIVFPGNNPSELIVKFSGNEATGTVMNKNDAVLGSYYLAYPELLFNVQVYYNETSGNLVYLFTGSLSDATQMSGTVVGYFSNFPLATLNGTWTGTR